MENTKIFGNGFINSNDYKSRPRAKYEEHIHQKYINYSSIDRPSGKGSLTSSKLYLKNQGHFNKNSGRDKQPKRRYRAKNDNQRGRSYQPKDGEIKGRIKYETKRNRNSSMSRAMDQKYQELLDLRSKKTKHQRKPSRVKYASKDNNDYSNNQISLGRDYSTNFQKDVKISRFQNIEIEAPELIESSEFETVYTSVVNFKDNESRGKEKDMFSYRPRLNRDGSDQFKMSDEHRFWRNDLEFKAFFGRKRSEIDCVSKKTERDNFNALENRHNFQTKRKKNPEVGRIFKEDNDMILGSVSDKAVKRLVEYMYDDFLESIASSKKNKTALTLLFEVKMGSKKLNREPMLYSLMRRYQQ